MKISLLSYVFDIHRQLARLLISVPQNAFQKYFEQWQHHQTVDSKYYEVDNSYQFINMKLEFL